MVAVTTTATYLLNCLSTARAVLLRYTVLVSISLISFLSSCLSKVSSIEAECRPSLLSRFDPEATKVNTDSRENYNLNTTSELQSICVVKKNHNFNVLKI